MIAIHFLTAVFTKEGIATAYPGGLEAFRADYPEATEDDALLGIASMSGGDMGALIDDILGKGTDLSHCHAIADMYIGPMVSCPAIRFRALQEQGMPPGWVAEAVSDARA